MGTTTMDDFLKIGREKVDAKKKMQKNEVHSFFFRTKQTE
ncbi:MAG: hypothetical protein ACI9U0_001067 [Flavobacteriales bacterium]|jgi:hypothetical protein|tara:strand:+ start:5400 stop:5519 length:120 start_codon:yes stop_codon:yes gene_type:complete